MERQNKKRKGEWQEDDVSPLPQQVSFDNLLAQAVDERLERFDSLPEPTKLRLLLYPQAETTRWPEREPYPDDWKEMLKKAMNEVRGQIQARFPNQQAPAPANTTINTDDSDESEDDDGIYEPQVVACMNHGSSTPNTQQSSDERDQLLFLKNLPICLPIITYGFHVVDQQNNSYCFCPCGGNPKQRSFTSRWRRLCGMAEISSGSNCNTKNNQVQKSPSAFLQHLSSKASHGCKFHRILYDFLEELFKNFNGLDGEDSLYNQHIAFLDEDGPKYLATLGAIERKKNLERKKE